MTTIDELVKAALTDAANDTDGAQPGPVVAAPAPTIPRHVAANVIEFLKRVQVTGLEAFALCEAIQTLQQFAGPAPTGPGVPFRG